MNLKYQFNKNQFNMFKKPSSFFMPFGIAMFGALGVMAIIIMGMFSGEGYNRDFTQEEWIGSIFGFLIFATFLPLTLANYVGYLSVVFE